MPVNSVVNWFVLRAVITQTVYGLDFKLDDRGYRVLFPARFGNFSLYHHVQNGSGAYTASFSMGTRVSSPRGKAAGS